MGDVQAKLKVMPESTDVDLDELLDDVEEEAPDDASLVEDDTEAVAFGLEALLVWVRVPDGEGGMETVEEHIDELDDVESVRSEDITRV